MLALAKRYVPSEAPMSAPGHAAPGVPQVAAFMDAAEPCLFSVHSATVLAAIDALLTWAKATGNEYWRVTQGLLAPLPRPAPILPDLHPSSGAGHAVAGRAVAGMGCTRRGGLAHARSGDFELGHLISPPVFLMRAA